MLTSKATPKRRSLGSMGTEDVHKCPPLLVKNKMCDFAPIDFSTDQLIYDLPVMCCAIKKKSDAAALWNYFTNKSKTDRTAVAIATIA